MTNENKCSIIKEKISHKEENMDQRPKSMVSAFRKYARRGYDKMGLNIFEMCDMAKGASADATDAAETVAVYRTIKALEFTGREETASALRAVYFSFPERPLKKNEISWRVRRFASESYMDERTVYRHLKTAKSLFSKFYENGIKK